MYIVVLNVPSIHVYIYIYIYREREIGRKKQRPREIHLLRVAKPPGVCGENKTRTHWRKAKRGYIMDQLSKYGWK